MGKQNKVSNIGICAWRCCTCDAVVSYDRWFKHPRVHACGHGSSLWTGLNKDLSPHIPKSEVHNPSHYTAGGIDTIDYTKAKLTPEMLEGAYLFNVFKYLSRYRFKDGLSDLKKAQVYLNWLVELKEKQ